MDGVRIVTAELINYPLYSVVVICRKRLPNEAFEPVEFDNVSIKYPYQAFRHTTGTGSNRGQVNPNLLKCAALSSIVKLVMQSLLDTGIHHEE